MKPVVYPSVNNKLPVLWYGADYNPEQWLPYKDVLKEDIRLMKLSGINVVSLGIFAWTFLEPEEGHYEFGWMDDIINHLYENGIHVILATPSAGKPQWLMHKYPEVMLVDENRKRALPGQRINHCYTSPVFRDKVTAINRQLAQRYNDHPAIVLWHVSNELSYQCHCNLCQNEFRIWLKQKYSTLENLNHAWWTAFWSHTYSSWEQIESPSHSGENSINGLNVDWKRFVTDRFFDYLKCEIAPLKEHAPDIPVTTNFMGADPRYNQHILASQLDVISLDAYPCWHNSRTKDWLIAVEMALNYDLNRCLKGGRPFLLMETTPSVTNWMEAAKQKRPGLHKLACLQTIAHGSDSVLYFQWRKGRSGFEKFHGAIVDHAGHENTRVFSEVTEVGQTLRNLTSVTGSTVPARVALLIDWDNRISLEDCSGPRENKAYMETCYDHYRQFWKMGVSVDVLNDSSVDFSEYKLLIAPMYYMIKPGVAERIEQFVRGGGVFVATYFSGICDENNLTFLGGFPGPLRNVLGIWAEETDALYAEDTNGLVMTEHNKIDMSGRYTAGFLCDVIHAETACVLAEYTEDYYKGLPALTANKVGKGTAYYIASRNEEKFLFDFYNSIVLQTGIVKALKSPLPEGVTAQVRTNGIYTYLFIMNFTPEQQSVVLDDGECKEMLSSEVVAGKLEMEPFGIKVLRKHIGH